MNSTRSSQMEQWHNIAMVVDMHPRHLHSRTRKRFRDGRPDEETVYGMHSPIPSHGTWTFLSMLRVALQPANQKLENTLHKLFSAQQPDHHQIPETAPTPSHPRPPSSTSSCSSQHQSKQLAQQSLHSFFSSTPHRSSSGSSNIARSPPPPPLFSQTSNTFLQQDSPRCEDCDTSLLAQSTTTIDDAMDIDMDINNVMLASEDGAAWACAACGRRVCDTCAVRRDGRLCLGCATAGRSKRWVGGIGWM